MPKAKISLEQLPPPRGRFRESIYPTLGRLALPRQSRRLIDALPPHLESAPSRLAQLLLRLGIDAGQPTVDGLFQRTWQRYGPGPNGQNSALTAWNAGSLGVSVTFSRPSRENPLFSGQLEVVRGQTVSLGAQSRNGAKARGVWSSESARQPNFRPDSANGGSGTPQDIARVFQSVVSEAVRGLADESLVADVQIVPVPNQT